ncbi:MAG: SusD/RagB family nutrient-binding outer membrane lipoprotein [Daejeonella sp.]
MKINKLLIAILFLVVASTACKKALDINDDPNFVSDSNVKLLLPSGIMFSASRIGGDYEILGGVWAQHYAQNNNSSQYRNLDQYNIINTDYNTAWNNMWAGALKDLKTVTIKSKASGEWNYYMAATIMSAFDYHILNDLYGAIPIQEGLDLENNPQPKFVASQAANGLIIGMLDDAISKATDAKALPAMGAEDFIFHGDIDNWVKFAKSLKLKILMRDFATNQAAIQTLLTENDLLNTMDAKVDVFIDAENKSNPLYEQDRRKLNTAGNLRASNTLLTYLLANNDPRIAFFYEKTGGSEEDPNVPEYAGLEQGDYTVTGVPNEATSRAVIEATDPVYFMSAAEVAFLKAEAYARLGNAANAIIDYNAGVTLAFDRWELDAMPFISVGGAYQFTGVTLEQMVEQIITQKWVASTRTQAWNAFFDQNRTGYPSISAVSTDDAAYVPGQYTISVNTSLPAGEIPRRLLYPKSSSDYNPNTPVVVPLYEKMWWQK